MKTVVCTIDYVNANGSDDFIINDFGCDELEGVLYEVCGVSDDELDDTLEELWNGQLNDNVEFNCYNAEEFYNSTISHYDIKCEVDIFDWCEVNGVRVELKGHFIVEELYENKEAKQLLEEEGQK